MKFIISRSGFCQHCYNAGRPQKDDLYVLHGTTSQTFRLFVCTRDSPQSKKGFVPMIYEKLATQSMDSGVFVHYIRTCGICGIEASPVKNGKLEIFEIIKYQDGTNERKIYIHRIKWRKGMMPERQWNALCKWKNTGYELDNWKYPQ